MRPAWPAAAAAVTVVVANPYVFNKRGAAFARWLDDQDFDVALLNEMRLLHDDVRPLGHLYSGAAGEARNNVVLTRRPAHGERVVKLAEGVPESRVWKDRFYVRAVINGVAYYAVHANAMIQAPSGVWRENEGARRWQNAILPLVRALRADLDAGLEVVLGGDLNWRHGKPSWVVGSSPEWLCRRLGLKYVTTQVMWLAYSPGVRLERWRRLPTPPGADGHPVILAKLTRLPKEAPVKHAPPSPPVIGGTPHKHSGTGNKPIDRVVIHSAVTPCRPGMARLLGRLNQTSVTGSWHYATDPKETFQCSWDRYICWHAPPNPNSLGIEMADTPGNPPSDVKRPNGLRLLTAKAVAAYRSARRSWRWAKPEQRQMLRRTARLTADLCLAYDVPLRFRSARALRKGKRGITTHANVSAAWGESTHWDPGWWPRRWFMVLVRRYAREVNK